MNTKLLMMVLISGIAYCQKIEKNVIMANTNFNIPMVQFTPIKNDATKKGNVSFFNSVGAGVGLSFADLTSVVDNKNDTIHVEVKNKLGIQSGFLFSANSTDGIRSNNFAWTISLILLDFQIGYGHEFGSVGANQSNNFFLLSYNIPLSKLARGSSYIFKRKEPSQFQARNPKGFII